MLKSGFLKRSAMRDYTNDCIKKFDVRCGGTDATASSLSGGNLQKFIMGRELLLQPKLLFVAQPTWGVDVGAATAIRQRLLDLANDGVAVLIISEEIEELFEISDRLYVINDGELSPSLTTSDVTPNDVGEYMVSNRNTVSAESQHAV